MPPYLEPRWRASGRLLGWFDNRLRAPATISTAVSSYAVTYIWGCAYRRLEIAVDLDGVEIGDGIIDIVLEILYSADEVWEIKLAEGRVDWTH